MARAKTRTHEHLRNRLLMITWVTIALILISTLLVDLIERHAESAEITSVFDAFLFSTSRLLTASSIASPQTDAIRVLELGFDVYAITVVAALAGSFGSFFHARSKQIDADHAAAEAHAAGDGPAPATA